eukprot:gene8266-9821_t
MTDEEIVALSGAHTLVSLQMALIQRRDPFQPTRSDEIHFDH